MKASWVRDYDLTPSQNFLSQDPQVHEDLTQELRFASPQDQRFRYSVGLSYFEVDYIQQGNGGHNIWGSDGGVGIGVVTEADGTPIPGTPPVSFCRVRITSSAPTFRERVRKQPGSSVHCPSTSPII